MPEDELDPGASTQMFQAFVDRREPEETGSRGTRVAWLVAAVAALVVVLLLAWLLLGH